MKKSNRWQDYAIFIILLFLATIVIFTKNIILGVVSMLGLLFSIYYAYILIGQQEEKENNFVENLNTQFDELTKNAVFQMPFAIAVLDMNGRLKWYNSKFKSLFKRTDNMVGESINALTDDIDLSKIGKGNGPFEVNKDNRHYYFYHNVSQTSQDKLILLYGIDNTEDEEIKRAYIDEKTIIAKVVVDNYDELKNQSPEKEMPYLAAEMDRVIGSYFGDVGSYTKKYENDKYLIVMEEAGLEIIKKDGFKILDKIGDLNLGNKIPPTLSIGVGRGGDSPDLKNSEADLALDMALGRGGDQVVIKAGEDLEFFGGRTQSQTKRNTVKSRVFAHALSNLIDESQEVFVMGHKNPDMDSFGACLGIYTMARQKGKDCTIFLKEVNSAIKNLYNRALAEIPELKKSIISCENADAISSTSLVVVVDNNRYESVECEEALNYSEKKVVIDHHRRGSSYIKEASLSYVESSASSTSELVTEMMQYMLDKIEIPKIIAEGLLAGIMVDTKNFNFQTSSRTFEAASLLKRQGADSMIVKELFKDDLETIRYKSDVVSRAEKFMGDVIISNFDADIETSTLIASQAADEMLNIEGVEASFVLAKKGDIIHISGRSLGKISVQIILERLGGGGHLTAAATQLEGNLEDAENKLKEAIEIYKKEDDDESNID